MYKKLISKWILKSLQYPTGVFAASKPSVNTGYDKMWIRDCIYEAMGLEQSGEIDSVIKTFHAIFDILKKHEYKIDYAIAEKPDARYKYVHPRYHPFTFDEFHEEWGNKQNDSIGAFLFKVADLEDKKIHIIRNYNDIKILKKLVKYLESIQYWEDKDNGIWEENEEIHASSVGACLAGLKAISKYVPVPEHIIFNGQYTLDNLLPRESKTKETDLALISLIFPYNIVSDFQREKILENIEKYLVREKGVARYIGDNYYHNGEGEAEWTMGFPWLARIYKDIGNKEKYKLYMGKTKQVMNWKYELPELYYAKSGKYNENTPLGWSQAMYLIAS